MEKNELAKNLADRLIKIAYELKQKNESEAELQYQVEKLFDPVFTKLKIKFRPRHNKTICNAGYGDAVYPTIVIEYKKPGKLKSTSVFNTAKNELDKYLRGLSKKEAVPRKYVGIGLDGENIFFLRSLPSGEKTTIRAQLNLSGEIIQKYPRWEIQGPMTVSEGSIEQLLIYFRGLSHKVLTSKNLTEDFGSKSKIGTETVQLLYKKLSNSKNPKVKILLQEWERIFGIVYGEGLSKVEKNIEDFLKDYKLKKEEDAFKKLLFTIHTYFAFLMKMIVAELLALQHGSFITSFVKDCTASSNEELKKKLEYLEEGGLYKRMGIENFMEGGFFSWYLNEWDDKLASSLRHLMQQFSEYEPSTAFLEPDEIKDILKKLYQYLVPKFIRHDLGEYYTPDWLAETVINEIGYNGDPEKRILDPACGSGTFLALILKRILRRINDYPEIYSDKKQVLKAICSNVVGYDINPIAVLAARTNYLIAISDLRRIAGVRSIKIPIYLADSVLAPQKYSTYYGTSLMIRTIVGDFRINESLLQKNFMENTLDILEDVIEGGSGDKNIFLSRLKEKIPPNIFDKTKADLEELFKKMQSLKKKDQNGIWARIIKNGFAPVYIKKFDYIVGNPPWIRWGYLSDGYREATLNLWKQYGLFSLKGMESRLGGGEKDFSMLFVYVTSDSYLKEGGKLGFLITQEVFKSKGAGKGFRRFKIGDVGKNLKMLKVHDLVKIKPFEDAANKTAFFVLKKGEKTTYPVPYTVWEKKKKCTINPDLPLSEVLNMVNRTECIAEPIRDFNDSWQHLKKGSYSLIKKMRGKSQYLARRGGAIDPYGIFYLTILDQPSKDVIVVENHPELGKKEIEKVTEDIETDLVFPCIRGSDIKRWGFNSNFFILLPQDPVKRAGYDEKWMMTKLPKTYKYLLKFKKDLNNRKSRVIRELAKRTVFYSVYGIGEYTLAEFKVVWKRMADDMQATVVTNLKTAIGTKPVIPTDTTAFVSFTNLNEAHYICAVLNSNIVREFIKSFSSAGRGFGAPSVLSYLQLPLFDKGNDVHKQLSELSKKAHRYARNNKENELKEIENEIDNCLIKFWNGVKQD